MAKPVQGAGLAVGAATALVMIAADAARAQDASASDPAAFQAAMQRCGAIVEDQARHACTDDVLHRAGMMASPEARSAERRRTFGLDLPKFPFPARRQAAEAAASPVPEKASAQPPPVRVEEDPDRVTVTLDRVVLRGDGKLVLTTTEGVAWRQVESDAVLPMPTSGQAMAIERTALGGFMCKTAKWTAFRCTREP